MRKRCWPCNRRRRAPAFSLVEMMMVLLVMAVLAAGVSIPLSAHLQVRRSEETRRLMEESRDAVLGFAVSQGRLPCPATTASRGQEAFAPGGNADNGACESFHGGFLPAAALGMAPLDPEGFARDPWATTANRLRYAVHGSPVNGVTNALTRANGMQAATLQGLGAAGHYLYVCLDGARVDASGCGPAANQLTRRAAFLLLSTGQNASEPPLPGSDEARNLDGDGVFVSHEASSVPGREFDDVLHWVTINLVVNRMVTAGRLP
jgi:prepilin-type N-terminal cleavage/methylation domain-containing protein